MGNQSNCCSSEAVPVPRESVIAPLKPKAQRAAQEASWFPLYPLLAQVRKNVRESEKSFIHTAKGDALFQDPKKAQNLYSYFHALVQSETLSVLYFDAEFKPPCVGLKRLHGSFPGQPLLDPKADLRPNYLSTQGKGSMLDSSNYSLASIFQLLALSGLPEHILLTKDNKYGFHALRLFPDGAEVHLTIDDQIPFDSAGQHPSFISSQGPLWPLLLHKAWSKLTRSFSSVRTYSPADLWEEFTGCPVETVEVDSSEPHRVQQLLNSDEERCMAVCSGKNTLGLLKDQPASVGRHSRSRSGTLYELFMPFKTSLRSEVPISRIREAFEVGEEEARGMNVVTQQELLSNFKTLHFCYVMENPNTNFVSGKGEVNVFRFSNPVRQKVSLRALQHFAAYVQSDKYEYSPTSSVVLSEESGLPLHTATSPGAKSMKPFFELDKGNYVVLLTTDWPPSKQAELDIKVATSSKQDCAFASFTKEESEAVLNRKLLGFAKQDYANRKEHQELRVTQGVLGNWGYVLVANSGSETRAFVLRVTGCENVRGEQGVVGERGELRTEVRLGAGEEHFLMFRKADLKLPMHFKEAQIQYKTEH